jgi:hypothetical protein
MTDAVSTLAEELMCWKAMQLQGAAAMTEPHSVGDEEDSP